ncbi:hypothetical protein VPH35_140932 [Triticum aestivum]
MGSVVCHLNHAGDVNLVYHHMENGGCIREFMAAMDECHPDKINDRADPAKRVVDAEACARATAALRKCFGRNPQWFKHKYMARLDHGLDEDLKPSPEKVNEEGDWRWRWWTGMRRS